MSSFQRLANSSTRVKPYEIARFADVGDVSINPLDVAESLASIESFSRRIVDCNVLPIAVGGDHLVSLPLLRGTARRPVGLIHLDAHSDTDDFDFTGTKLSHGTPFRRAIEERLIDPKKTVQVGIRGSLFDPDELSWARAQGVTIITFDELYEMGVKKAVEMTKSVVEDAPTYLTFDIDVFDPSVAPGTGTPEWGGCSAYEMLSFLRGMRSINFVGADLVEVSPPFDVGGTTALLASTILFEVVCLFAECVGNRRV